MVTLLDKLQLILCLLMMTTKTYKGKPTELVTHLYFSLKLNGKEKYVCYYIIKHRSLKRLIADKFHSKGLEEKVKYQGKLQFQVHHYLQLKACLTPSPFILHIESKYDFYVWLNESTK